MPSKDDRISNTKHIMDFSSLFRLPSIFETGHSTQRQCMTSATFSLKTMTLADVHNDLVEIKFSLSKRRCKIIGLYSLWAGRACYFFRILSFLIQTTTLIPRSLQNTSLDSMNTISLSKLSSQQATSSNENSLSGTQKLRRVASKVWQKMMPSKSKDSMTLSPLSTPEVQSAKSVKLKRPTEGPRIIDLRDMRQSIRTQPAHSLIRQSIVSRSQTPLNSPEIRPQSSFETSQSSSSKTGTPPRTNLQQAFYLEANKGQSAVALLDDITNYEGYEWLGEDDYDVDWTLLDLPENIYGRLANESRHSLI